ncbi:MAG: CPBP family intramembrane metalloprotease [Clostridia bacterium]|nr:CPBP family intramembrane metalloprotease [Clostridia bacterium]
MTEQERYYKQVMGAVGMTMLSLLLFINLDSILMLISSLFLGVLPITEQAGEILYQILYGIGYFLSFCLPIPILYLLLKKKGRPFQPMSAPFRLSLWFFPILFAGIAVILSASYFNASLVSVFRYSDFSSEMLWGEGEQLYLHQIVLQFFVICVIPGFCEELLFRGVILSNCLPFGRFRAIFISALLFSLMHQNAEQIFYAFVAGILLGILYERTRNIWYCVFLHVLNNFFSVFSEAVSHKIGDSLPASLILALLEGGILILGILSFILLITRFCSKKASLGDGVFQRTLPPTDFYQECPIGAKEGVKYFFRPSMIVYLSLCGLQILTLIGMAVLYGFFN